MPSLEYEKMQPYLEILRSVLNTGIRKKDRTGTGVLSLFGGQTRYNLGAGFPLLTTKKIHFKSVLCELLWFIRGETNIRYLHGHGVHIWDPWADENGDLGPVYGYQWRSWPTRNEGHIDQLATVLEQLKTHPESRRLLVSAWNVAQLDEMCLPPCHLLFQFYVVQDTLSCQFYQRSADIFLGVPFNIASYALLTLMVAQVSKLKPGFLIHTTGDVHLYTNHIEQARIQIARKPKRLPTIQLNPEVKSFFEFGPDDIRLENYHPQPAIKAELAI